MKIKILICEDELIIALDLKRTLIKLGYEVTSIVKTSEDLIHSSETENPDLIISDIRLNGNTTSVEALKHITSTRKIPVIFLSGLNNTTTLDKALLMKPSYYIAKPFDEDTLRQTIEKSMSTG